MRSTQIWARRATAALLSLAMVGGGIPPAALAEALGNQPDVIELAGQENDTNGNGLPQQNEGQSNNQNLEEPLIIEDVQQPDPAAGTRLS